MFKKYKACANLAQIIFFITKCSPTGILSNSEFAKMLGCLKPVVINNFLWIASISTLLKAPNNEGGFIDINLVTGIKMHLIHYAGGQRLWDPRSQSHLRKAAVRHPRAEGPSALPHHELRKQSLSSHAGKWILKHSVGNYRTLPIVGVT